jgi:hypothetical protein
MPDSSDSYIEPAGQVDLPGSMCESLKIWLSDTLNIIRKPKVWWTDMRIPIYPPHPTIVERGIKTHKTLFCVENRDYLGFRMIFKVWLNQIFSNFNTILWNIKYRLNSITVYYASTVPELIWLSDTLNIIRKPKVWWTDMRIPIYPPHPTIVERGIKTHKTLSI